MRRHRHVLNSDRMNAIDVLRLQAVKDLSVGQQPITKSSVNAWPRQPGLYAVYGAPDVWHLLSLGAPPDGRPLYVGKAERSLSSRDVRTHFGYADQGRTSITGSSTLRRSLAALLRTTLELRGRYRNLDSPGKATHYGLSPQHDQSLSDWMRHHLTATFWVHSSSEVLLGDIETAVLQEIEPPLNLQKVPHRWRKSVKSARAVMAADCTQPS